MPSDKETKKWFKQEASRNFEKYYAVDVLREEGFERKKCKQTGTYFWTVNPEQEVCGDPSVSGGFRFFGKSPATREMDYIELWKEFSRLFTKWGYTPIKRYPVVARWRDDTDFVQASIYDFQPFVVSGEVEPPANPLVVPQFSLRFNDIDNVGITGSHYTGFVMIGQHAFDAKEKWSQKRYFNDIYQWLRQGLGLAKQEITFHEDAWAGGGNFGPCMEFFSRGLELGNQVYMMYEQTPSGNKELDLKVLDMGMGHERNAWFTKGTSTSYETTFPTVCRKLFSISGVKTDPDLMSRFLPYSSYLNVDEVEDIDAVWGDIAKKIGTDKTALKESIIPLSALFSIAEHSRSLLFALGDGALPSNVGGGYNLRVILRRALSFNDKYQWKIDINDLCDWHAQYLKPLFPETSENLENVKKILDVEKRKFAASREKTSRIVSQIADKEITPAMLLELYDSKGISPELVKEEAGKKGKAVAIPDDFYAQIAERHERVEQEHATIREEKLDIGDVPDTIGLYFDDYLLLHNQAKVLKILGKDVLVDQTSAYPTSGGQIHDLAFLNGIRTEDIFKQGGAIIHRLSENPTFRAGDEIHIEIDRDHRVQLTQHHTATHIVNAAARKILGSHINQAGAKKTGEKAHLDITHYDTIEPDVLLRIEEEANAIVQKDLPVRKFFMSRSEAEKKYGMRIYQGGAVPGKKIRIVDIEGEDVEACGGTHLNRTAEVGRIRIIKSSKIQDGIVRLTFTAGKASEIRAENTDHIVLEASRILGIEPEYLPARAKELFLKWKKAKKAQKKGSILHPEELTLTEMRKSEGDPLLLTSSILKTQKEHIVHTLRRFLSELNEVKKEMSEK